MLWAPAPTAPSLSCRNNHTLGFFVITWMSVVAPKLYDGIYPNILGGERNGKGKQERYNKTAASEDENSSLI